MSTRIRITTLAIAAGFVLAGGIIWLVLSHTAANHPPTTSSYGWNARPNYAKFTEDAAALAGWPSFGDNPAILDAATSLAKGICNALQSGQPPLAIATDLAVNGGWSPVKRVTVDDAQSLVASAHVFVCSGQH